MLRQIDDLTQIIYPKGHQCIDLRIDVTVISTMFHGSYPVLNAVPESRHDWLSYIENLTQVDIVLAHIPPI